MVEHWTSIWFYNNQPIILQPNPQCQSYWSLSILMVQRSALWKRLVPSMNYSASSSCKTELERKWRTSPAGVQMIQKELTQKFSSSGWLEGANCQWPGPPLLRSYVTLDSPPLLMVSALSNVFLQTENSMHRNACYNNSNNSIWVYRPIKSAHHTFILHVSGLTLVDRVSVKPRNMTVVS